MQQYPQQPPRYNTPVVNTNPTWSLAWGLLWRMWLLQLPLIIIYGIITALATIQ